jgi:hypothetical protein
MVKAWSIQTLVVAGAAGLAAAACSPAGAAVPGGSGAERSEASLCAVHQEWSGRLTAGAATPAEWASMSVGYLRDAQQVAPEHWQDEISLVLPYWEASLAALDAPAAADDLTGLHGGELAARFPGAERAASELEAFTAGRC